MRGRRTGGEGAERKEKDVLALKTYIFRPRAEGARKILDPLEGGLPPLKSENRALPPLIADFRGGRPQDALWGAQFYPSARGSVTRM